MTKEIKQIRLTEEEQDMQIFQNKSNIESQITLTDINTTDIEEIKIAIDYGGIPVTENLTGALENLETETKENLVAAINEVNAGLIANNQLDNQQQARLQSIEDNLAVSVADYALLTYTGQIVSTTTTTNLIGTVTKNFDTTSLAELNTTSGVFTIKKPATITTNFHFTANQLTGDLVTVVVVLWNITKGTAVDSAEIELDFSGSINQSSGSRFNKGDVDANDQVSIRAYTKTAGNVVNIVSSAMDFEVAAKQGQLDAVFDYNVISTNTELGNSNVSEDIISLNTNKAEQTDLESLETRVSDIEAGGNLSDLEERVSGNEESILALQNANADDLNQDTADTLYAAKVYETKVDEIYNQLELD